MVGWTADTLGADGVAAFEEEMVWMIYELLLHF